MSPVTIRCEDLYWAIVPHAPVVDARRFRCERLLPLPVDGVHLAETRLADGRWLMVGMDPQRLAHVIATAPGAPWLAIPDRIPPHLGIEPSADLPARLNLLHGPFAPAERRRWRQRTMIAASLAILVLAAGVIVGVERRVSAARSEAADLRARRMALLAEAVPPIPGASTSPDARLIMELRRLDQARALSGATRAGDAADTIQAALAQWPAEPRLQVEALTVAGGRLIARGRAARMDDAQQLARAWGRITVAGQDYRSEPIQVQQAGGRVGFVITLVADQP